MANSGRATHPELVIIKQSPEESYPLTVSGQHPVYVDFVKAKEIQAKPEPDFEIANPFRRIDWTGNKRFLKVSDGWLVSLDAGEFGSWFGWYSESGEQHYKISDFRAFGFQQMRGHIYVYGGGCGGNVGKYGFISKLGRVSDVWAFTDTVMFPDCVLAFSETQTHDGEQLTDFLVLTSSLIYNLSPIKGKELLFGHLGWHDSERGTWRGKGPNSIARDLYGNFFIGTNHGVIGILRNRGSKEFPMALLNSPPPAPVQDKDEKSEIDWQEFFETPAKQTITSRFWTTSLTRRARAHRYNAVHPCAHA